MSNYPINLDTDDNLYEVHDGLRVKLIEDYNPGDTSISVIGDEVTMSRFSDTGIITLTEQCSEIDKRALSFYYGSKTSSSFDSLVLLEGFEDVIKSKNITNVTQNVMAVHHNSIKDAIISIENFSGLKGEVASKPLEGTMEQRINYLRNLALVPKAWFRVNKNIGLAPLTVEFEDRSFRLGTDGTSESVKVIWDFGDNSGPSIIEIEEDTEVPSNTVDVLVNDTNAGKIIKTYSKPGIYDVKLTVINDFGEDSVTFKNLINARFPAPDYAVISFAQRAGQIVTDGSPSGGPYDTPPKIRSVINSLIDISINSGINSNTDLTYSGEVVDETYTPIDPIINYTWSFSDDLSHNNSTNAKALFSIGGYYDLSLRTDTSFGAYRITTYENSFDIVEKYNLWLWTYDDDNTVSASEFGLISETFKINSSSTLTLNKNDTFLDNESNAEQLKKEFNRNNGFAPRSATSSGNGGTGILYWASGRDESDPVSSELIKMTEFNGFSETYLSQSDYARPWNWVGFNSSNYIYFILGGVTSSITSNTSPTNQTKDSFDLNSLTYDSPTVLTNTNYKNGANELMSNEVTFNDDGDPNQGHMSVYRSCWKDDTGYILRNEGVDDFFRIKSFYKTTGNVSDPFQNITKLTDMTGSAKVEGQLVSLSQGVYFFNNSGTVSAYNPITAIWNIGGPGANSVAYRALQDTSITGFDDNSQTFLAASDGDKVAYLSFDYSRDVFFKFNEIDTTFSAITSRLSLNQWQMNIF